MQFLCQSWETWCKSTSQSTVYCEIVFHFFCIYFIQKIAHLYFAQVFASSQLTQNLTYRTVTLRVCSVSWHVSLCYCITALIIHGLYSEASLICIWWERSIIMY